MRSIPTCLLPVIMLTACGDTPVIDQHDRQPGIVAGDTVAPESARSLPATVDTMITHMDPITEEKPGSPRTVDRDEGCAEYMGYSDNTGQITLYIPKGELAEREEEIRSMLPGLYEMVRRSAPRSISDDFERGIATEHIHMPDTLPVMVRIHDRCRDREPYAVKRFRVWPDDQGGWVTHEE